MNMPPGFILHDIQIMHGECTNMVKMIWMDTTTELTVFKLYTPSYNRK